MAYIDEWPNLCRVAYQMKANETGYLKYTLRGATGVTTEVANENSVFLQQLLNATIYQNSV